MNHSLKRHENTTRFESVTRRRPL